MSDSSSNEIIEVNRDLKVNNVDNKCRIFKR